VQEAELTIIVHHGHDLSVTRGIEMICISLVFYLDDQLELPVIQCFVRSS
jgi:hypothetical protein